MFTPNLGILPPSARRLFPELGSTPGEFVLYGGTALALRLGHRPSEDFDFCSSTAFDGDALLRETPYLRGASVLARDARTLVCRLVRGEPVRVSFFGVLPLGRVLDPDPVPDPAIRVASLLDLAATKAQVVQARSAARDYLDMDALISRAGISLARALGAALAVFGQGFNPALSLKALACFGDGDLDQLPQPVRARRLDAVRSTDLHRLPAFEPRPGLRPSARS